MQIRDCLRRIKADMEAIYIFKFNDNDYIYKKSNITNGELQIGSLERNIIGGKYKIIKECLRKKGILVKKNISRLLQEKFKKHAK